jgi:tRNA (guanine10-N2)-dimethyltransferase
VRILVELSGEHPTLPRAEALAALEAEGVDVRSVSWTSRLLALDATGPVERAMRRLALAHVVSTEIARGSLEDVRAYARDMDLAGASFRVRARGLDVPVDAHGLEAALGADLDRTGHVDLTSPEVDLRLLVGEEVLLGRILHRVERSDLEARKVAFRPFSRPISLHPKLAHALVNLARVPVGGTVLDPFCGTGGVLLEASRIGLRGVGADVEATMVRGARGSLQALRGSAAFAIADARAPPWRARSVDGVATDPPYGRAASTRGAPLLDLYARAFATFAEVLPPGGHVAAVLPNERAVEIAEGHLEPIEAHPMRVHRSLTRTFCAFRRR